MNLQFDTLPEGMLVTLVGLLIVFFGLIVLIILIGLINKITRSLGPKEPEELVEVHAAPKKDPNAIDDELLAVISAAIAAQDQEEVVAAIAAALAMMDEGTGFRVRRVRLISNAPAWNRAGREEQVYSRY